VLDEITVAVQGALNDDGADLVRTEAFDVVPERFGFELVSVHHHECASPGIVGHPSVPIVADHDDRIVGGANGGQQLNERWHRGVFSLSFEVKALIGAELKSEHDRDKDPSRSKWNCRQIDEFHDEK